MSFCCREFADLSCKKEKRGETSSRKTNLKYKFKQVIGRFGGLLEFCEISAWEEMELNGKNFHQIDLRNENDSITNISKTGAEDQVKQVTVLRMRTGGE
jgi:hypothetical protein